MSLQIVNPEQNNCQVVKLYPGLSANATKSGKHKELALWYCLRSLNYTGCGHLYFDEAITQLVQVFHYTEKTLYRQLKAGNGLFWDIYLTIRGRRIKIYGLKTVCEYLDTYAPGKPFEIDVSEFTGVQARKACLYSSTHTSNKPISRQSLTEKTGVSIASQKRYDKVTGTKRTAVFATCQDINTGKHCAMKQEIFTSSGILVKDRRLGNIYHTGANRACRGMTKKVTSHLRQSLVRDEACTYNQRFFLTVKSYIRRCTKRNEAFLQVPKGKTIIPGRVEFCLV